MVFLSVPLSYPTIFQSLLYPVFAVSCNVNVPTERSALAGRFKIWGSDSPESISNVDNSCAACVKFKLVICPLFVSVTSTTVLRVAPVVFAENVSTTEVVHAV